MTLFCFRLGSERRDHGIGLAEMDRICPFLLDYSAVLNIGELSVEFVPKWKFVIHGGNFQFVALIQDGLDGSDDARGPATEHLHHAILR